MKKNRIKVILQNLLIYFIVAAFLGWVLEMMVSFVVNGSFVERGFLYGPFCPIYGFGIIFLILITQSLKKRNITNILLLFLINALVFTALEYVSAVLLEWIFDKTWWDYTNEFMNFQGRIALFYTVSFGVLGLIFMKFMYDPIRRIRLKAVRKFKRNKICLFLIVAYTYFLVDFVFSVLRHW